MCIIVLDLLVELSSVSMYIATSAVGLESGPVGETNVTTSIDVSASS
jgi:hypothetical protein